jgi:peptidoglycan/xylan/chitin deacetylase (PgdA/CDA1 family)
MPSASSPWPESATGAVSLTFDDAMPSQLNRAIPILEEFGLRGTFYVNPNDAWMKNAAPWVEAASRGHEIGNHTLGHPCSQNFAFIAPGRGLESMTLESIEADIVEAEARLNRVLPGQPRSFCYPCYQDYVGQGAERQSYVPVVARHFIAGRGRGEVANDPATIDLHYLGSWPVERSSGPELVGMVEQAASQGRWAILTFHGVQEGHLMVGEGDFRELCQHLSLHRERIWTAPVVQVAQRIAEWRKQR